VAILPSRKEEKKGQMDGRLRGGAHGLLPVGNSTSGATESASELISFLYLSTRWIDEDPGYISFSLKQNFNICLRRLLNSQFVKFCQNVQKKNPHFVTVFNPIYGSTSTKIDFPS
jgi:hypothetical protein